jgi:hypothetical protein
MEQVFVPRAAWVLSGSLLGWGEALIPSFDSVIFMTLEPSSRLSRLRRREQLRYGSRVEPGGDREAALVNFLEWAAGYDDPEFIGRSLTSHESWLAELPCPVLRVDGSEPTAELVSTVLDWAPAPAP